MMTNNTNNLLRLLPALLLLCLGYGHAMAQTTPDPGLMGTHAVTKAEYDLGDTAYLPPSAAMFTFPVTPDVPSQKMEVAGCVHYPSDLSGGPFPVILFLHGMHDVCYETADINNTVLAWPCPAGYQSVKSYEGYDYLAKILASNGYIVISISSNAINAINNSLTDYGMNARGVLIQHHLDLWKNWNTTGGAPFGTTFVGKLDMQKVGTMGHSRGGEGVVFNAEYNKSLGSPYGIKAVLPLAPVDFFRHVLNDIPLMNIAPYCDGDVSDLEGVHFYDDARYNVAGDQAPKHNVLMMGANHNFFNTVWSPNSYVGGSGDDWSDWRGNSDPQCGLGKAPRFDTVKQRAALNAYLPAFFRAYVGNETQFLPILEVKDIVPPVSSKLSATEVFVSYHPGSKDRLDVNRTDALAALTTNTLTGAVTESGLKSSSVCGGGLAIPSCNLSTAAEQEPHSGDASTQGLSQMAMQWNAAIQYYQNDIPVANQDISGFQDLMYRTTVDYKRYKATANLDYTVQLTDADGKIAGVQVSKFSNASFHQPGKQFGELPKDVFNTIRIPLDSFTGVNRAKIRSVKFLFDKSDTGAILISDLAFTNSVCGNFAADYKDSIGKLNNVIFTNKTSLTTGDTLVYLWKFGDPASGTKDTSTAINPTHTYSVKGTYTACLIVQVKRKAGSAVPTCVDSFCTTVTVWGLGTHDAVAANIRIIPNPARDYLQISGAEQTDVLRLTDLYGRVVFTKVLTEPVVHLPQALASGVYYATITTDAGNVYQKIVITR